jgi:uncharacterized phosphosugar-binding protein
MSMLAEVYIKQIMEMIQTAQDTQMEAVRVGAKLVADAVERDGLLHVFGCGHSQMYAEEVFYRAGGLVPVNAILEPALSLRPEAPKSTWFERIEGYAQIVLEHERISPGDVMLIASTSGRNAVPVEMAIAAKERGMYVIALTSLQFTNDVTSRHPSGKKLIDLADIVLDNCGVSGDAIMEREGLPAKFGPTSSVIGFTLLQSLIVQTVEELCDRGVQPPIWVSSNLDKGDAINAEYIRRYKDRIKCL